MGSQNQQQGASSGNTTVNGMGAAAPDAQSINDSYITLMELRMIIGLPMALKAVMTLGIPKILAQSSGPLSSEEIVLQIQDCKNKHDKLAAENLRIIMSILVQNNVFSVSGDETERSPRYSNSRVSRLLVDVPEAIALLSYNFSQHVKIQKAWLHLHEAVLDSGARPFKVANGMELWEAFAEDDDLRSLFHNYLGSWVEIESSLFLHGYNGFEGIQTLVDVGGSYGVLIGTIVRAYPHIRGINYDLPHIIASAPNVPGVEHVGGNFFDNIPKGDAILLKSVLHDWNDEQCIKILQNCRKSLPESGKVIIFEQVLLPLSNNSSRARLGHKLNLTMLALSDGKERYAEDWAEVISAAGFPRHRIIEVPGSCFDIIEASMS